MKLKTIADAQAEITSKQAALDNLQSQYDDALNQVTLTEAERDAFQSDLQQENDLDQANNNLLLLKQKSPQASSPRQPPVPVRRRPQSSHTHRS